MPKPADDSQHHCRAMRWKYVGGRPALAHVHLPLEGRGRERSKWGWILPHLRCASITAHTPPCALRARRALQGRVNARSA